MSMSTSVPGLRRRWTLGRIAAWSALLCMILITLLPLWVVVKTALMRTQDLYTGSTQLLPSPPTLVNFERVLGLLSPEQSVAAGGSGVEINFLTAFGNSLAFTVIIVLVQTASSAMAAYAFASLRFPGRRLLFGLFLSSMMIPSVVLFIPNFILIKDLGWLNSMAGMVAPFCLMSGFSVFFLRQFFLSIPRDLEEAAIVEGASYLYIFRRIVVPVSVTPLATIATLISMNAWNEFLWPFLVAKEEGRQVLTVALQAFQTQSPQGQPDWTGLMAAPTLALLPSIVVLVSFGRRIVESVQYTGGK
jgi:multiple sugar transport system permease protein